MVEITLRLSEDELKNMVNNELSKLSHYDGYEEELIKLFFSHGIDNESLTMFYGPVNLKEYVKESLERLKIIHEYDNEYATCKRLWDLNEYQTNNYVIVEFYHNLFLIEKL